MEGILKFLHFVSKSPQERLIKILTKNDKLVRLICEILLNIMVKNIKVAPHIIKQLKKHKRVIYKLVDKRTSITKRKRLLVKAWPIVAILTPLIPLIAKALKNEPLFKDVSHHRNRQGNPRHAKGRRRTNIMRKRSRGQK